MDFIKNFADRNQDRIRMNKEEISHVDLPKESPIKENNVYGNIPKEVYNLLEEVLSYVYALEKNQNMK